MKRNGFALISCIITGVFVSAYAYNASQVNAKAVSVQWRHGIDAQYERMCVECWNPFPQGAIMVYTITNGSVQPNPATIYTRDKGLAEYPAFNFPGTKIAFFRSCIAPAATGNGSVTVNGGKSYVSIINTNGTGLINLAEIRARPGGYGDPGSEMLPLDWPAGDWIYYENPYASTANNPTGVDIWRVNASTGVSEEVCNLSQGSQCVYWRRFSLTANADKMAGQTMGKDGCSGGPGGGNCIWQFPVPGCNLSNGKSGCRAACNISISPSGAVIGSYMGGMHQEMELGSGTPGTYPLGDPAWGYGVNLIGQLEAWAGEPIGIGCELIRWSANSDKWVMQNVGWYGHADNIEFGSNSIACDWVDKIAFNITKNPKLPHTAGYDPDGVMYINNCTGDMWISDPVNNPQNTKYEDLQGAWHAAPGAIPTAVESPFAGGRNDANPAVLDGARILVRASGDGPWEIVISAADGRIMRSQRGTGLKAWIATTDLGTGVYMMKISSWAGDSMRRFVVR